MLGAKVRFSGRVRPFDYKKFDFGTRARVGRLDARVTISLAALIDSPRALRLMEAPDPIAIAVSDLSLQVHGNPVANSDGQHL